MNKYVESFGAILSPKDFRDYQGISRISAKSFPAKFELDMSKVRIKNQGSKGSCVAHALSTAIEFHNIKQHNMTEEMSVGYIYGNRENSSYKDKGMIVRDALGAVCKYGDVRESLFPEHYEVPKIIKTFEDKKDKLYDLSIPYRFSSYFKLKTEKDIKACLINNQIVVFAMNWYSDIKVKSGVINTSLNKKKKNGSHCMIIYGWNEKGWKIQNSWGVFWGNGGRAILPYNIPISEAWGIVDNIREIDNIQIKKPLSSQIGKRVAKALNKAVRICGNLKV